MEKGARFSMVIFQPIRCRSPVRRCPLPTISQAGERHKGLCLLLSVADGQGTVQAALLSQRCDHTNQWHKQRNHDKAHQTAE